VAHADRAVADDDRGRALRRGHDADERGEVVREILGERELEHRRFERRVEVAAQPATARRRIIAMDLREGVADDARADVGLRLRAGTTVGDGGDRDAAGGRECERVILAQLPGEDVQPADRDEAGSAKRHHAKRMRTGTSVRPAGARLCIACRKPTVVRPDCVTTVCSGAEVSSEAARRRRGGAC
jgi:hypothetical protein